MTAGDVIANDLIRDFGNSDFDFLPVLSVYRYKDGLGFTVMNIIIIAIIIVMMIMMLYPGNDIETSLQGVTSEYFSVIHYI